MIPIDKHGKPRWLKRSLPKGSDYEHVRRLLSRSDLNTVCQEAKCPNMWECFSRKTSTFMILGSTCTRNCRFCNVASGTPSSPDPGEAYRVARAVSDLKLSYVVITSVTRDDLEDGGASQFARTIGAVRALDPQPLVEVLIPDFRGNFQALCSVIDAGPAVLNHNIETVPSLYPRVRPEADYHQSLLLLRQASDYGGQNIPVKSGIMVGLGETMEELESTFRDLLAHGCSILTVGQYLQPSTAHLPVSRYYSPDEFEAIKTLAVSTGFTSVAAGPFVRSSYNAEPLYSSLKNGG